MLMFFFFYLIYIKRELETNESQMSNISQTWYMVSFINIPKMHTSLFVSFYFCCCFILASSLPMYCQEPSSCSCDKQSKAAQKQSAIEAKLTSQHTLQYTPSSSNNKKQNKHTYICSNNCDTRTIQLNILVTTNKRGENNKQKQCSDEANELYTLSFPSSSSYTQQNLNYTHQQLKLNCNTSSNGTSQKCNIVIVCILILAF